MDFEKILERIGEQIIPPLEIDEVIDCSESKELTGAIKEADRKRKEIVEAMDRVSSVFSDRLQKAHSELWDLFRKKFPQIQSDTQASINEDNNELIIYKRLEE